MTTTRPSPSPTVPVLLVRFPAVEEPAADLEARLVGHHGKLRTAKGVPSAERLQTDPAGAIEVCELSTYAKTPSPLGADDWSRVQWRVRRLCEARRASNPFARLKADKRKRLQTLRHGIRLISVPSEHFADELAASLHTEFPWLAPATERVWQGLRPSVREGLPGVRMRPLLLDGPPGIGKSVWARRLACLLGTPATIIDATTENASFGVVGSHRGWGNSAPGRVIENLLRNRVGNPVVVIDEVEKAGLAQSTNKRSRSHCRAPSPPRVGHRCTLDLSIL